MADTPQPLSDERVRSLVQGQVELAIGYRGNAALSADRRQALRYYRGEKFGNEIDGRSQIVSRDVAEVVDGMLPDLIKPFVSGDETVVYEPRGPEDEESAKQATDYANFQWNVDNAGFQVVHDWVKDGLLARVGVIKVWWEVEEQTTREEYSGLTEDELMLLHQDPSVTGLEATEEPAPMPDPTAMQQPMGMSPDMSATMNAPAGPVTPPMPGGGGAQLPDQGAAMGVPGGLPPAGPMGPPPTFSAVVHRTIKGGRVCIRNVPPEEFLTISERIQLDDKPFCAHRCRRTISYLREQGYPEDLIKNLGDSGSGIYREQERQEREEPESNRMGREEPPDDPSLRETWVVECYLKMDADGDGIAEYRMVTLGGDQGESLLGNEEVDDHPFAAWSPYPIPHKFHGESVADKVMDVQLTKSAILRQMLDNLYLINNARTEIVEGKVNLDDFLSSKPGGYVRVKEAGAMREIVVPPVFQNAFPALEYLDTVRENRSGSTRYNQGMDANTLNKTATGISAIMGKAAGRLELIARIFAELGMRRAFRIILKLNTRYQDKPRVVRLRNKWVPVDPRDWNAEMDVSVSVGLGTGNKDQQLGHLMAVWQKQLEAMKVQGGPDGPLVTLENMYETATKLVNNAGLKNAEAFFSDPSKAPPKPPQPDPAMIKIEKDHEAKMQEIGLSHQADMAKIAADNQIKQVETQHKANAGAYAPQPKPMPGMPGMGGGMDMS